MFVVLLLAFASAGASHAQEYPSRPIRLIIPFGPGGGLDIQARLISQKMSENWKQPVVVDFRPGAAGNVGAELAAKSAGDGYTLLLGVSNLVINPLVYANTKYDVHRDFVPLSLTCTAPQVLVAGGSVPAKSLAELIKLAKSSQLTYAITGTGSVGHLSAELFSSVAGIKMISVPYKGSGAASADLLGGHVQLMFAAPGAMMSLIKAGKVKALAVTSRTREVEGLEDVPTFIESGYPTVEVYNWFGMFSPAGTPRHVAVKLNQEIVRIIGLTDVKERIIASGYAPVTNSSEQFAAFIRAEGSKWARLVKASGVRVN
jgi:tripartite-type tricarboxylate transporter receptor subunit TctC